MLLSDSHVPLTPSGEELLILPTITSSINGRNTMNRNVTNNYTKHTRQHN